MSFIESLMECLSGKWFEWYIIRGCMGTGGVRGIYCWSVTQTSILDEELSALPDLLMFCTFIPRKF